MGALASGSEMTFGHTVKSHLGEGSFGTVFAAVGRDGSQIAIKHIEYTPMEVTTGNSEDQRREVEALLTLKHPNIVRLLEVNRTLFSMDLVFEKCETTLAAVLNHPSKLVLLSCSATCHYSTALFKALAYVHEMGWLHRDVKPANILMNLVGGLGAAAAAAASGANARLGEVKLADVGWARRQRQQCTARSLLTRDAYTLWYRCPEMLLGTALYGPPSDVWAMGCVCVEMSEFKPAFACTTEIGMLFKIFDTFGTSTMKEWPDLFALPRHSKGKIPRFPRDKGFKCLQWGSRIGVGYTNLIRGVLEVVPENRWSAASAANWLSAMASDSNTDLV